MHTPVQHRPVPASTLASVIAASPSDRLALATAAGLDSGAKCTGLCNPDLHVLAKLFEDCLKRGLEAQAFSGREIGGHDDVAWFVAVYARRRRASAAASLPFGKISKGSPNRVAKSPRGTYIVHANDRARREKAINGRIQTRKGTPLFNPWAPEFIADPYPFYHQLRATDPMHLTPLGFYVASRHGDVTEILRDKRFGKDFIGQ